MLIGLSFAYAALLLSAPSIPLIAIGLWWTANTVAHNFIHTPFFRSRALNRGVLAVPVGADGRSAESVARPASAASPRAARTPGIRLARPDVRRGRSWTRDVAVETGRGPDVVGRGGGGRSGSSSWASMLPGYLAGLGLCSLQGHFEHARGTTSHYGWLYNWCFFNDGYHAEHHLRPGEHWTRLPSQPLRRRARAAGGRRCSAGSTRSASSRWSAGCCGRRGSSGSCSRPTSARSRRCCRGLPPIHRVTIVGGGLYPRSALILRRLLPDATLTIVDAKPEHLEIASAFLPGDVELEHRLFDAAVPEPADLVVIPLAFIGDRDRVYRHPPAKAGRGARLDVEAARGRRAGIVAAAQAAESRHALRAACLLAVLVSAKAVTLLGRHSRCRRGLLSPISGRTSASPCVFFVVDRALETPGAGVGRLRPAGRLRGDQRSRRAGALHAADVDHDAGRARAAGRRRPSLCDRRQLLALAAPLVRGGCAAADVQAPPGRDAALGGGRRRSRSSRSVRSRCLESTRTACTGTRSARWSRRAFLAWSPRPGAADWRASPFGQPRGEDLGVLRGSMKGRNVILVVLESTGARHLGAYGAVTGSDAEPHRARAAVDRLRARVCGLSREHQGPVRDAVLAIPGLRYAARDSTPDVPCAPLPRTLAAGRLPDGALSLGPVRLSRHAGDDRAARVRPARRRGRDRRPGELELRRRRRLDGSAGASVDRVARKGRALLPDLPADRGTPPLRGRAGPGRSRAATTSPAT